MCVCVHVCMCVHVVEDMDEVRIMCVYVLVDGQMWLSLSVFEHVWVQICMIESKGALSDVLYLFYYF